MESMSADYRGAGTWKQVNVAQPDSTLLFTMTLELHPHAVFQLASSYRHLKAVSSECPLPFPSTFPHTRDCCGGKSTRLWAVIPSTMPTVPSSSPRQFAIACWGAANACGQCWC